MLKGIPEILPPDLLAILREMGHGDELAIVDANFPAATCAKRLVRIDAATATDVLKSVLMLLPLDQYVEKAAQTMEVVDSNGALAPIAQEFAALLFKYSGQEFSNLGSVDRFEFYERAKGAFAIVVTGERRLYGNILLKKGVIEG